MANRTLKYRKMKRFLNITLDLSYKYYFLIKCTELTHVNEAKGFDLCMKSEF